MNTTFIFAEHLKDEGGICLSLDTGGQIIAACEHRTYEDIRTLQTQSQTIVVIPSQHASLHSVELPWLGDKKARAALPYALEDQLAQNVDELHFAYDKHFYADGQYLVAVCDKQYLSNLIARLKQQELNFETITLDWFALENNTLCMLPTYLLVHLEQFKGALSNELTDFFLTKLSPEKPQLFRFSDSPTYTSTLETTETHELSMNWIAKGLIEHKRINLCQGDFYHGNSAASTRRWYIAAAAMTAIWLMGLIIGSTIKIQDMNHKMTELDKQIAAIYRQYFPQAQQVISPRFRISQLIKSNLNSEDSLFWVLLDNLSQASKKNDAIIEQLRFQNKVLQVTLISKNFESLESLQNSLIQSKLKVRQTQASTQENQVVSTLELTL